MTVLLSESRIRANGPAALCRRARRHGSPRRRRGFVVIAMFGQASPLRALFSHDGARRLATGFLFGLVGALIAVSPIGKVSGAHISGRDDCVLGKGSWRHAMPPVCRCQLAGALLAVPV